MYDRDATTNNKFSGEGATMKRPQVELHCITVLSHAGDLLRNKDDGVVTFFSSQKPNMLDCCFWCDLLFYYIDENV